MRRSLFACLVLLSFLIIIQLVWKAKADEAKDVSHYSQENKREASQDIRRQNAIDAENKEKKFANIKEGDKCDPNDPSLIETLSKGQAVTCAKGRFAHCSNGKFEFSDCAPGTQCFVLPLVNSRGVSSTCGKYD